MPSSELGTNVGARVKRHLPATTAAHRRPPATRLQLLSPGLRHADLCLSSLLGVLGGLVLGACSRARLGHVVAAKVGPSLPCAVCSIHDG